VKRLSTLLDTLAAEELAAARESFADRPRLLRATGPVPDERLVVDDLRSVGPWVMLADGSGLLDAGGGQDHAPLDRVRAYAEGAADLGGDRARRLASPPSSRSARAATTPAADLAARGVLAGDAVRVHAAFDDAAHALLAGPVPAPPSKPAPVPSRVRPMAEGEDPAAVLERVIALESAVYEPERRDPPEKLRKAFVDPRGVVVLAEVQREGDWELAGFTLGVPLESVHGVDGVDEDPRHGAGDTLYALTTTLDPTARGLNLGLRLKAESIRAADALGYRWISGRNRVGATAAMMRINRKLGGHVLYELHGQYGGDGVAAYYRLPVGAPRPAAPLGSPAPALALDDARVLTHRPPPSFAALGEAGGLYGAFVSPVEPDARWTTAAIERARRLLAAVSPELPHVAFARTAAPLRAQAEAFAGRLRRAADAAGGFADETRTAGWRGDGDHFFAARRPRAALWSPRPGLHVLHAAEPVTDHGGDALTLVRAAHDVRFAFAHRAGREPLEPLLRDLGFEGGEAAGRRRFFTRRYQDDVAPLALADEARDLGVALGAALDTLFVALPWDLGDPERAKAEEVLRTVLR